jgi:hypothetical protein
MARCRAHTRHPLCRERYERARIRQVTLTSVSFFVDLESLRRPVPDSPENFEGVDAKVHVEGGDTGPAASSSP